MRLPVARSSGNWIRLILEDISVAGAVELLVAEWRSKAKEHELGRLIDSCPEIDRDLAKVRHLEGDRRLEPRVDLRCRDVNRDPALFALSVKGAKQDGCLVAVLLRRFN
jgi:hypothetical protein